VIDPPVASIWPHTNVPVSTGATVPDELLGATCPDALEPCGAADVPDGGVTPLALEVARLLDDAALPVDAVDAPLPVDVAPLVVPDDPDESLAPVPASAAPGRQVPRVPSPGNSQ